MSQSSTQPIKSAVYQSITHSIAQSSNHLIHISINQSTNQSINPSIKQPINQSIQQPIIQSTHQPINQSTNTSTNQPINTPTPLKSTGTHARQNAFVPVDYKPPFTLSLNLETLPVTPHNANALTQQAEGWRRQAFEPRPSPSSRPRLLPLRPLLM